MGNARCPKILTPETTLEKRLEKIISEMFAIKIDENYARSRLGGLTWDAPKANYPIH